MGKGILKNITPQNNDNTIIWIISAIAALHAMYSGVEWKTRQAN